VLFATFDDQVTLRQDFTDRLELLTARFTRLRRPARGQRCTDAIWQFCDQKMRSAQGRRTLVIITGRVDTYSRADINDAIGYRAANRNNGLRYFNQSGLSAACRELKRASSKIKPDKDLDRICDETGAQRFSPATC